MTLIVNRCDSFNTVQLQLLSESDTEAVARLTPISNASRPEASEDVSGEGRRGRSRHLGYSRQPTTSAPPSAIDITRNYLESTSWPSPIIRHAISVGPDNVQFAPPSPPTSNTTDPDDSMDTDEDVDFWGGESPRSRLGSPAYPQEMTADTSGEEDEEDDSEDEDMSDDDDGEEDETDEYHRMEIFGHR